MRLALIVPRFPKLSETFIVSKFLGLLERGWDVYVVCGESCASEWDHLPELCRHPEARKRVRVAWPHRPRWVAAGLTPLAALRCLGRNPKGCWRYLRQGATRFGPDVLRRGYLDAELLCLRPDILHFEFGALAVDRMYLKDLLGCRVVVSFRGYDLNISGLDQPDYYHEVWENSDGLHVLSHALRKRASERGCPAEKVSSRIPPALGGFHCTKGTAEALPTPPNAPLRILSVGRMTWEKGLEFGLQAVRELSESQLDFHLRIIGQGCESDGVSFAAHQLGLEGQVDFLGALPPERVREELRAADIFLHSAVSEGFCNAVMEAQAMGLPVVCTDAGGLPENVVDGVTGFVVPRRDPHALADKLALLARDPELRQRLGCAGRQRVLERFRLEDQLAKFEALYRQVLAANPSLSPTSATTS